MTVYMVSYILCLDGYDHLQNNWDSSPVAIKYTCTWTLHKRIIMTFILFLLYLNYVLKYTNNHVFTIGKLLILLKCTRNIS